MHTKLNIVLILDAKKENVQNRTIKCKINAHVILHI